MLISNWPVLYQIVLSLGENPSVHQFLAPLWLLAFDLVLIIVFVMFLLELQTQSMGPGAEVGSRPFAQAVRWCPVGQCTLGSGGLGGAGRGCCYGQSSTDERLVFRRIYLLQFLLFCANGRQYVFYIRSYSEICCMILQYTGKQQEFYMEAVICQTLKWVFSSS